ncbi:MAG: hypothetical protein KIT45_01475 [Fimbriimonadia bacterium]|nr:hypothetical protein [Fimbriimonadia bacterium]
MISHWLEDNPFWSLENRRLTLEPLAKRSLLAVVICAVVISFWLVLISSTTSHSTPELWIFLGILVCGHLIARGLLQGATPAPHFERDARSGSLEQFRMLPLNPHGLILQRGLPLRLHRLCVMMLWLPGYALWGSMAGLPLIETIFLWAIFSFVDYLVLAALSLFLLVPFAPIEYVLMAAFVGGYSWVRERSEGSGSQWAGAVLGIVFGLAVFGRLLAGHSAFTLPDLRPFFFTWICVEGLRFERLARWLNEPQGLWRWYFLAPVAGITFLAAWLTGEWSRLWGWQPLERLSVSLVALYAMGSFLHLYFCQINRAGRALQQSAAIHRRDSGLIRLTALLTSWVYCAWIGQSPFTLSWTFWGCFLFFSLIDIYQSASLRSYLQTLYASRFSTALTGMVLAVLSVPAALTASAKSGAAFVSLTLPAFALLSLTPAWKGALGMSVSLSPLILCAMVLLRALMVEGLFRWLIKLAAKAQAPRQSEKLASVLIESVLIFPLLHRLLFRSIQNPVIRFLTASDKRTADFGFFALFLGLSLWLDWQSILGLLFWGGLPLAGICWYLSYRQSYQRVRRLLGSGEFRSWLTTPLSNQQLYWGIIYSGWMSIWKGLLAIIVASLVGQLFRELFITGRMMMAGVPAVAAAGVLSAVWVMVLLFVLCVLLVATPTGVHDALSQARTSQRRSSGSQTLRAVMLASLYSILTFTCCLVFAPLALIALPVYSSSVIQMLNSFRRAPDDRMRLPHD